MKKLTLLFLQLVFASSLFASESFTARIINGQPATANYNFFASILTEFSFTGGSHWNPVCGASYIGDGLILTAAHCVYKTNTQGNSVFAEGRSIRILIGDYSNDMQSEYCSDINLNTNSQNCTTRTDKNQCLAGYSYTGWIAYTGSLANTYEVTLNTSNTFVHEGYNPSTLKNDIAIIQLSSIPDNAPILLPTVDEFQALASNRAKVRVLGHGDIISDDNQYTAEQSQTLLQVNVTARPANVCQASLGTSTGMVCAGDPGLDSCQGDSGGPLITTGPTPYTLLGIVSSGPMQCGSAAPNAYGIYTDVYHYLNWVESVRTLQARNKPRISASKTAAAKQISVPRVAITDACSGRTIADEIPWAAKDNGDITRLNNQTSRIGALPYSLLISLLSLLLIKRRKDDI